MSDADSLLENEWLRLSLNLDEGTFSLSRPQDASPAIPAAWTEVALTGEGVLTSRAGGFEIEGEERIEDRHGPGRSLLLRRRRRPDEPDVALTLTLYDEQPFLALRSALRNTTDRPLRVDSFHVIQALLDPQQFGDWRLYKHGWQSWSPSLVLSADEDDLAPFAPVIDAPGLPAQKRRVVSDLVGVVAGRSGVAVLAGFVSTAHQSSQVCLDREPLSLLAASHADAIEVGPGDTLSSERGVVYITPAPLTALAEYGEALGREMGATFWPRIPAGWCSWYHYFGDVTEGDILSNLEELAAHRGELPLEYVQIDDGYQSGIGDWLTANEKFPHGMAWLAERIHECGFKAGLWLAPFLAGERSRLYAEHPDWLVRDDAGAPVVAIQNWGQLCYALDCTNPDVIDWLERVFRTVTGDWGYGYVKIDFVYATAVAGRRHDVSATRAQAYRRGLEAVRRAVGDRFVLGCGAPIGPSVGLVNGMRVSADVAPYWYPPLRPPGPNRNRSRLSFPSAFNAIRGTIGRFWTHSRLWLNDPDCLLLRDEGTDLTPDEVRTLATVIGMSGGMLLDSDDLTRLSAERREMLRKLSPLRGTAAVPLDLFERDPPQLLWRAEERLLAVINWSDEPADLSVEFPAPSRRLVDFWTTEELRPDGPRLSIRLPAHGCRLLNLLP